MSYFAPNLFYHSSEPVLAITLILAHCPQLAFLALSILITGSSVKNLQAKNGLPLINQVSGWVTLGMRYFGSS